MKQPFRYLMRVRYGECDAQRVVFNAKYGEYLDLASTEFMRSAFPPRRQFDGSFEFQVAKLLIEWKAPARFDDVLEISARVTKMGNTSFTLGFEVRIAGYLAVIVTGETVNVHVHDDNGQWKKATISDDARQRLLHNPLGKITNHAGDVEVH